MFKKKLVCVGMICIMALSGCGGSIAQKENQEMNLAQKEEEARYEMAELTIPDSLMAENAQGSDYIGDSFEGFVSDLQGKPAVYYSNISLEGEEYFSTITRWTLDGNNWQEDLLCENSFSEFLNQKYEQTSWKRCQLGKFRRGDNGSLYGVFSYYVTESSEEDGEVTEKKTEKYSILEIDEENDRIFEIPLMDMESVATEETGFGRRSEEDTIGIDIRDYHAFEDGNILIVYSESGGEYGRIIDGETGYTAKELGNIVNGRRKFAFGESEIVFFSNDVMKFRVLSVPDLEEQNVFGAQLSEEVIGKDWFYYVNPDTWEMFLCNETGVYEALNYQDSDDVECISGNADLEGLLAEGGQILDFFMGEEEDFYLCLYETTEEYGVESNQYRMVHYVKESK